MEPNTVSLCCQAEWCLLFKYVLQFPALISEMASSVCDGAFRIVPKVNKVYQLGWILYCKINM